MRPRQSALALLLALWCLVAAGGCSGRSEEAPRAHDGRINLSAWDFTRNGPVALNGQWEYYWDSLLTPEELAGDAAPLTPSGLMNLPGTWQHLDMEGRPLPGRGQATFRLRLDPGPGERQLALRLFSIHGAYRLWADGKLLACSGVVGRSVEAETPHRSLVVAPLATNGRPVELVLQISNHTFRRGGVLNPVVLGLPEHLQQAHVRTWAWAMFFAGSILVMAMYHFALYFMRKKDVSTLYFGTGSILFLGIYATLDTSDWLVTLFLPDASPEALLMVCLGCLAVIGSVLCRFYRSLYPQEFKPWIVRLFDIRSVVFGGIILTQPQHIVYDVLPSVVVATVALNCCKLTLLVRCLLNRRGGAAVLLAGYFILSITSLNDLYWHVFSVDGLNLVPFGLLAFVLSQALAMAQRFSQAFASVEKLSTDLRTEMEECTRLEREIVNVSEEERRRLSHDLHDGLCQQLAGIRLRCTALARQPAAQPATAHDVAEIAALLKDAVGQAYDLSRGLWPVEHAAGGLGLSLEEMTRRMAAISGVRITYHEALGCVPCRSEQLVQLYRIAQEAVNNALKHAHAARIAVSLTCAADKRLTLAVRDDGVGRNGAAPSPGGLGMRIMDYRARMIGATLHVDDAPEGGTVVTCALTCAGNTTTQENHDG